jgi:arginase family enzyme
MSGDICLLNFDGTLQLQNQLKIRAREWIDLSDLQGCHGYCEQHALRQIRKRLQSRKCRGITFIGSGHYHYVTYVLMSEIRQPFSLILFDHHTDLSPNDDAAVLSCGSWLTHALNTLPFLKHAVIIGANPENRFVAESANSEPAAIESKNLKSDTIEPKNPKAGPRLYTVKPENSKLDTVEHANRKTCAVEHANPNPGTVEHANPKTVTLISESEVKRLPTAALIRKIRSSLPDLPVYISVDKDVLSEKDAATNWDQGSMTLDQLLMLIRCLKQHRTVIAADVCGELPLSPLDHFAAERVRLAKMNEAANRAIADILTAS